MPDQLPLQEHDTFEFRLHSYLISRYSKQSPIVQTRPRSDLALVKAKPHATLTRSLTLHTINARTTK